MTQRTLKLHGSLTILGLGFVASMAACLGDDSTEGPRSDAAAAADHVTGDSPTATPDNSSPRPDSAPDTSVTLDAGRDVSVGDSSTTPTPDGGGRDSTPEATTADARDSAPEAARESGSDSNSPVEAGPGDARVDQVSEGAAPEAAPTEAAAPEAAAPEAAPPDAAPDGGSTALQMCPTLDVYFSVPPTDAGGCDTMSGTGCPDRATYWASPMTQNYIFGPIGGDCRIASLFTAQGADVGAFFNDLTAWGVQFFGCPDPMANPVPPPFGLVVSGLTDTVLTSADLRLLSDYWVMAVNASLSDAGAAPLTPSETNQINAHLDALAASRPNTVQASTYTFNSCPADAGNGG